MSEDRTRYIEYVSTIIVRAHIIIKATVDSLLTSKDFNIVTVVPIEKRACLGALAPKSNSVRF